MVLAYFQKSIKEVGNMKLGLGRQLNGKHPLKQKYGLYELLVTPFFID